MQLINATAYNSATFQWTLDFSQVAAVFAALGSATIRMQVKTYATDAVPLLEWATGGATGTVTYSSGPQTAVFAATQQQVASILGVKYFDIRVEMAGDGEVVVATGLMTFNQGVTLSGSGQNTLYPSAIGDTVMVTLSQLITSPGVQPVSLNALTAALATAAADVTAAAASATSAAASASTAASISSTTWGMWPTRSAFAGSSPAGGVTTVQVLGLSAPGDSPAATYVKQGSAPAHTGYVTTANSLIFVIAAPLIYPQQIGTVGTVDDTATVHAADVVALALGVDLVISQEHKIQSTLNIASHVRFESVGMFRPSTASLITFSGGFTAQPDRQIFDMTPVGSGSGLALARVTAQCVSPFMFGAVADNSTDDHKAVSDCFQAAIASGLPVELYNGKFKMGSVLNVDITPVTTSGLTVRGQGNTKAVLNFTGITTGRPFQIYSTTDWLRLVLKDFAVQGSIAGPLTTIGQDSFVDPCNAALIENFASLNSLNDPANEALRLNYFLNGVFINSQFNAYSNGAGTNAGKGIHARQVEFCTFLSGSVGGAQYGVYFSDGVSFCFNFDATTFEEVDWCLYSNVANNGKHIIKGGEMTAVAQYATSTPLGRPDGIFRLIDVNYGGANIIDPSNPKGVILEDLNSISAPSLPASGSGVVNLTGKSALIVLEGGTGTTEIEVDGVTILGSVAGQTISAMARPGSTITLTYGGSPGWAWFPV